MLRKVLLSKIHRARITQCDLHYVGSITIDGDLMEASGIRPNEAVIVLDIDNGARFETYAIEGPRGSGIIGVNGAAAHLVEEGHLVIVLNYGLCDSKEMDEHNATVVLADEQTNKVAKILEYPSTLGAPSPAGPWQDLINQD